MKNKRNKILIAILALLPVVVFAAVYSRLPAQVVSNWGFNGEVSYSGKNTLWGLVLISPLFAVFFQLIPKIDPRKKNYEKFRNYYDVFCITLLAFLCIIDGMMISEALWPGRISMTSAIIFIVGILFIVIGNVMPKVKSNFFMGVKSPWALSNNDVWNKTHRLAGILFFFSGLAIVASNIFAPDFIKFIVILIAAAAAGIIPYVMSFIWYQRINKE